MRFDLPSTRALTSGRWLHSLANASDNACNRVGFLTIGLQDILGNENQVLREGVFAKFIRPEHSNDQHTPKDCELE